MRYLYACFKNYIGFYNGMGLDKVEIDFTKCKNNIVLISGANGTGKSTLMESLSIIPDPNSSYIPERDGEKILTIFDDGNTYNIHIISQCDNKGGRKQTKAFISKNGLQLNDNGNITSYKEIIFSEFEMDANYISLSKLSGNQRGLGDKTPAERKKFVANIIDNLETYNDIYKTLNKKSLIFKSYINTLHTKIQNIGTKDSLEITLSSLKQREYEYNSKIMELNNKIVSIEAKSSIDEDEALRINQINGKYNSILDAIGLLLVDIKSLTHKTKIKETEISKKYKDDLELFNHYQNKISELRSTWTDKSKRIISVEESINSMEAEISSLSANIDKQLEEKYSISNKKLDNLKEKLSSLNIDPYPDMIFTIKKVLDFYNEFIIKIDALYERATPEMLKFITIEFDPLKLEKISSDLDKAKSDLLRVEEEIATAQKQIEELSILNNKPKNCKDTTCAFISKALKLQKELGNVNLEKRIELLLLDKNNLFQIIGELEQSKTLYSHWMEEKSKLDNNIINAILSNSTDLHLVNDKSMTNIDNILNSIANMSTFNDQRDPKKLIRAFNLLEELKKETETNTILSYEYKSFREKIQLINSTTNMLQKLKNERDELSVEIVDLKQSLNKYESLKNNLENRLEDEARFESVYLQFVEKNKDKEILESQINEFNKKSSKALEEISHIQDYRLEIDRLTKECGPISSEIQRITGQLSILESYYVEYNQYKEKYNMIETLKKYCSPTGGGIQTIFMQLYMSKTLELSNQVLGMLFGGEYKLLDFVINQNEFRIPFIGSGLPVDDISSGSASQICIMGMAINLVLLHQGSTKFNIARLDEVDQGLDTRNRFEYMNTLERTRLILQIEQLFVISHSIEADTSSVDIIKLKSYNDFEDNVQLGNVIWDYSEEIKKTLI